MKYVFEYREHEDYGSMGWAMKGCQDADPLDGKAVAHDILEHFPKVPESFGIGGEFMALGACYYLRGETGVLSNGYYTYADNIAGEFPEILNHYLDHRLPFPEPKPTSGTGYGEPGISEIIAEARKLCTSEDGQFCGDPNKHDLDNMLKKARGYMRIGYRKAARRYAGLDAYTLGNCLFEDIAKIADDCLKQAEIGMELTIYTDIKNYDARGYVDYPENWDEDY
jgi:hypothetical protein